MSAGVLSAECGMRSAECGDEGNLSAECGMRNCTLHGSSIPKGLSPPAQGCEERATLGLRWRGDVNPERVVPAFRSSRQRYSDATLSGLARLGAVTQGSSFLATL